MSDDFNAVEARAEDVFRGSLVYRFANAATSRLGSAWRSSMIHRLAPGGTAARIRFCSVATIAAAATTLLLSPFGTTPRPLAWLVPVVAGLAGVLVLAAAPRTARSDDGSR